MKLETVLRVVGSAALLLATGLLSAAAIPDDVVSAWDLVRRDHPLLAALIYAGGFVLLTLLFILLLHIVRLREVEKRLLQGSLATITERNRFRALLDTLPDPVRLKDLDGRIQFCNERFSRLFFNAPESAVIGKTDAELYDKPVLGERFAAQDRTVISSGEPLFLEESLQFGTMAPQVFQTFKAPIRDQGNQIIGVLGIAQDITEFKRTQHKLGERIKEQNCLYEVVRLTQDASISLDETLRQVVQRIPPGFQYPDDCSALIECNGQRIASGGNFQCAAVLEQAVEAITLVDASTLALVEANRTACAQLGYTREEMLQLRLTDIQGEFDEARIHTMIAGFMTSGSANFDSLRKRKDGTLLHVRISLKVITLRNRPFLSIVWVDITAEKHAQQTLAESETRFRKLFEDSMQPVMLIKDGVFVDANRASLALVGATAPDQLIGRSPGDLSPVLQPDGESSANKAARLIAEAFRQGALRFQWEHLKLDGEHFVADVMLAAIDINGEKYLHVVWNDITDRIRAEQTMRASEQRYRMLAENGSDVVWLYDLEVDRFAYVSPSVEKVLGFTSEEMQGLSSERMSLQAAAHIAHAIKGAGATLGAQRLAARARRLEADLRKGSTTTAAKDTAALEEEFLQLGRSVEALTAVEAAAPAPEPVVDQAGLQAALLGVQELLDSDDMEAAAGWSKAKAMLDQALPGHRHDAILKAISRHIDHFQLHEAAGLLARLREELGGGIVGELLDDEGLVEKLVVARQVSQCGILQGAEAHRPFPELAPGHFATFQHAEFCHCTGYQGIRHLAFAQLLLERLRRSASTAAPSAPGMHKLAPSPPNTKGKCSLPRRLMHRVMLAAPIRFTCLYLPAAMAGSGDPA